jgi:hypothetical protein
MKVTVILLSVAALLSGCSSIQTHRDPRADLGRLKSFFVVHRLTDDHHIDEIIVAQLKTLGREASAGPITMMPQSVDAVVTYRDEWAWDFRSYLIQLDIEIVHAHTNQPLARGSYRQPTIVTKAPPAVVEEVLIPLFRQS